MPSSPALAVGGPLRVRDRERHVLRHELFLHLDIVAAGAAQSARVPGVDAPSLRALEEPRAAGGRAVGVEPRETGEHVPLARIDAARTARRPDKT